MSAPTTESKQLDDVVMIDTLPVISNIPISTASSNSSNLSTPSTAKCSVAGDLRKGAKQIQEDSIAMYSAPGLSVGGIFDGHGGYNGKVASATAAACIEPYFKSKYDELFQWSEDDWTRQMTDFFKYMHDQIRQKFLEDEEILKAGAPPGGGLSLRERLKAKGLNKDAKEDDSSKAANNGLTVDGDFGVVRRANGYPVHGGTTASVSVIVTYPDSSKLLITANVGDSDAILILPDNAWARLSVDHGPDRKSEFLRIQGLDAAKYPVKLLFVYDKDNMYRKYECPQVFLQDGSKDPLFVKDPWGNGLRPTNVRYDPAVYAVTPYGITTDVTCIAMTRSLADFYAHQFGLSHEPSVGFKKFSAEEKFVVALASDGIWDCWHYEAFGQTVNAYLAQAPSLDEFVTFILDESIKKAKASFGADHIDDASIIVMLSWPFASNSSTEL
jgi:serine/threonine protein phosphatase PrpC